MIKFFDGKIMIKDDKMSIFIYKELMKNYNDENIKK